MFTRTRQTNVQNNFIKKNKPVALNRIHDYARPKIKEPIDNYAKHNQTSNVH